LAKTPSPSSSHGSEQRRGGAGGGRLWREGAPAALASAAAGEWGNAKRGTRGSHPRAHLEIGRREEVDRRRRTERGGGARGGGAVELGGLVDARLRCGAAREGGAVLS
jgi:hypothetical protein